MENKKRIRCIDATAWGNTPACVHMADILINHYDTKHSAAIGRIISSYCKHLRDIQDIKSDGTRDHMFRLLWKDTLENVKKYHQEEKYFSLLVNVLKTKYRIYAKVGRWGGASK